MVTAAAAAVVVPIAGPGGFPRVFFLFVHSGGAFPASEMARLEIRPRGDFFTLPLTNGSIEYGGA
jgi:hypothetical protein